MENAIHEFADKTLTELAGPEPDWNAVLDQWLELSVALKGTSWERAVDWLGEALRTGDAEEFKRALNALKAASKL